ncbi:MAG: hypothetical protein ABIH03_15410 [Pseudomonadota bacterium]
MLVGRAALGQTQMLTRYGIVLDESLGPQEKFNALLQIGAKSFGLAQAETRTASGQLKQAKNALGDAAEKLGKTLIPAMTWLTKQITALSLWFSNLSASGKKTVVVLGAIAAAVGPVLMAMNFILKLRMAAHLAQMAVGMKLVAANTAQATVAMNAYAAASTRAAAAGGAAGAGGAGAAIGGAGVGIGAKIGGGIAAAASKVALPLLIAYIVGSLGRAAIESRITAMKQERGQISGQGVAEYNLARERRTGLKAGETRITYGGLSKEDSDNLRIIAQSTKKTAKDGGRLP